MPTFGLRLPPTAERLWTSEQGEMARIAVTDTGPGISEADLQFIFDKFRQVDASHTKQHKGTGLGLAISRELANLLGGRIDVESELGHGATFSLTLPIRMTPDAPQPLMPYRDDQ